MVDLLELFKLLDDEELGLGNAYYANAYRVSGFIPGGLGLVLADYTPWPVLHGETRGV